jgi:hypothetical protein
MCAFQFRLLLICRPRNLVVSASSIDLSSYPTCRQHIECVNLLNFLLVIYVISAFVDSLMQIPEF